MLSNTLTSYIENYCVVILSSASGGTKCPTLPSCDDPQVDIHNNAVITGPFAFYPQYYEILPTTGDDYPRALATSSTDSS